MNWFMIIVGIAIFFYGYTQNKKMKKSFKNLYQEVLEKQYEENFPEEEVIENEVTEDGEKYDIIQRIKTAADKEIFYKEILEMLAIYEDEAVREEIAEKAGINKGEFLLLKNMYRK